MSRGAATPGEAGNAGAAAVARSLSGRCLRCTGRRPQPAEEDEFPIRTAFSQLPPCRAESKRPLPQPVAAHQAARLDRDFPQAGRPWPPFPGRCGANVIESGIGHPPIVGVASHTAPFPGPAVRPRRSGPRHPR